MQKWPRALLIPLLCFTFHSVLLYNEGPVSDTMRSSPLQACVIFVIVSTKYQNLLCILRVTAEITNFENRHYDMNHNMQACRLIQAEIPSSQNHSKKGFWHNSQEEEDLITWYIRIERRIYKNKLIESFCLFNVKCGPSNFIYFRRLISQI